MAVSEGPRQLAMAELVYTLLYKQRFFKKFSLSVP